MKLDILQNQLIQVIRRNFMASLEARQVASRLKELLPQRLTGIREKYLGDYSAARASRIALVDKEYQERLKEFIEISGNALESKIQSETHLMLYQARQTLRAFRCK